MAMQPHSVRHYLLSFHEIIALHAEIARQLVNRSGDKMRVRRGPQAQPRRWAQGRGRAGTTHLVGVEICDPLHLMGADRDRSYVDLGFGCCSIATAFSATPGYVHANWRGIPRRTLCCKTRCGSHFHSYGFARWSPQSFLSSRTRGASVGG